MPYHILCLSLLFFGSGCGLRLAAADNPRPALVRARVTTLVANAERTSQEVTLEILHVYSGSADLKGKTFTDTYQDVGTFGHEPDSPFSPDEEGLWSVQVARDGKLAITRDDRLPFRRWTRKNAYSRYPEHVKTAEAVERVEGTKPEERVTALLGLLMDSTPEVSAWAAKSFVAIDDPTVTKYLDTFAMKPDVKLHLLAQIALDEAVCKRKSVDWFATDVRAGMLRQWVAGKTDETSARILLQRLERIGSAEELKSGTASELVRFAAENKDWPWAARREAIATVGQMAFGQVDHSVEFDWLFDVIRMSPDLDSRHTAAYSLVRFPLYPKRLKTVEDFLATEKDEKVAAVLRAAIKKAKSTDLKDPPKTEKK